jgi:hypothetical protein
VDRRNVSLHQKNFHHVMDLHVTNHPNEDPWNQMTIEKMMHRFDAEDGNDAQT